MKNNPHCMLKSPCPGCPFSKSSIVNPERTRDIIETARRTQGNFICHKSVDGLTRIERLPERMTCRGFYDAEHKKRGTAQILRIVERTTGFTELELTKKERAEAERTLTPWGEQK